MTNNPQHFSGLRYVKECNLLEAWHEYDFDDERFVFLVDFNGVLCRVRVEDKYDARFDDYELFIRDRKDLGIETRVHVYEDVMRNIRSFLQDIESALRSASNMDVHYERGTIDKEQSERGKRGMLEQAEQIGYKVMQAIDASGHAVLEELLGVENGRKLFYSAGAVRSRTYQALDGSQSIEDVRMFIMELLTLVGLPMFPTPPPVPEADDSVVVEYDTNNISPRYCCYSLHNNPRSMKLKEFPFTTDDLLAAIAWIKENPMNFIESDLRVYDAAKDDSFYVYTDNRESEPDSPFVEPDSFAEQIYDTDSDWVREGLQQSLGTCTQETYGLRDEVLAKHATIAELRENLDIVILEREGLRGELETLKNENRRIIKDAFDAKYSLSLANIEITSLKADVADAVRERDRYCANYTMLEGEHEKLSDVFDQMQQERDDWKLRCESAKLELIEEKIRHDGTRQAMTRLQHAYEDSEASNIKLFYQRHKLAKQLVRRRNPRVVTLLK